MADTLAPRGVIGAVDRVEYWTNRPIWPQAIRRPKEVHEVPEHVKWDLWLGPAPERPYHSEYYHPFAWRGWWDFGTGAIGDIACHAMDAAFWIFDLRDPSSVYAESTPLFQETAPASTRITFEYPARGNRQKMTVVWRDGNLTPKMPPEFEGTWPPGRSGQMFVGTKGVITADIYSGPRFALVFGFISVGGNLGAGAGPWVTGEIFDRAGSYAPAFALCIALSLVSIFCIWMAAPRRVRLALLLSEVGRANNIRVSDEEVTRAMMEQARMFPREEDRVFEFYRNNPEAMQSPQAPIFEDKVVDYIFELAEVKEKKVKKDALEKAVEALEDE